MYLLEIKICLIWDAKIKYVTLFRYTFG